MCVKVCVPVVCRRVELAVWVGWVHCLRVCVCVCVWCSKGVLRCSKGAREGETRTRVLLTKHNQYPALAVFAHQRCTGAVPALYPSIHAIVCAQPSGRRAPPPSRSTAPRSPVHVLDSARIHVFVWGRFYISLYGPRLWAASTVPSCLNLCFFHSPRSALTTHK